MANHGIIVKEVGEIKVGSFVKYKSKTITHEGNELKVKDALLYALPIPEPERIQQMLNEVCPNYAFVYSPRDGMHRLVNFKFGNLVSERVPTYVNGEKTGTRVAAYIRHITVGDTSINGCLRRMFRQIALKRLYAMHADSECLTAIQWNEGNECFDVDVVLKRVAAQIGKGKMA